MKEQIQDEWDNLLMNYPQLSGCMEDIRNACGLMTNCYLHGGIIMTCGNGGSAANAEHIVGELMKGFKCRRPVSSEVRAALKAAFPGEGSAMAGSLQQGIPAIALVGQMALSTAFANDVAADMVFAQQVFVYGSPGDVLLALSTSGNSKNVVQACRVARTFGIKTVGMTGEDGGMLRKICDVTIRVPACETYRVQEYHLPVYHALCAMIEKEVFL